MANYLVLTKVDANLAPSAEQSTAKGPPRAAHLHPSGVAAGHEPLIRVLRPVLSPRIASVACANDATQRPLKTVGFPMGWGPNVDQATIINPPARGCFGMGGHGRAGCPKVQRVDCVDRVRLVECAA
jgi:hypothetical protein